MDHKGHLATSLVKRTIAQDPGSVSPTRAWQTQSMTEALSRHLPEGWIISALCLGNLRPVEGAGHGFNADIYRKAIRWMMERLETERAEAPDDGSR